MLPTSLWLRQPQWLQPPIDLYSPKLLNCLLGWLSIDLYSPKLLNCLLVWLSIRCGSLGKVVEKIATLKVVQLYLYLLTQLIQLLQLSQQTHNLLVWFHFVCGSKRMLKVHFFTINEHKQSKLMSSLFDNPNVSQKLCLIIPVHSVFCLQQYILQ